MTCELITVNNDTYDSLQQELAKLRQAVDSLSQAQLSTPVRYNYEQISSFLEYTLAALAIFDRHMHYSYEEFLTIKNEPNWWPTTLNSLTDSFFSNAIDALEDVSLVNQKREIHIFTEKSNNNLLAICIRDNGSGRYPEIMPKLFDPFFTTKDVGKGTDVALSISYQTIVEKHHGNLCCHSTLGEGTEFVIEIPINQLAAPNK
jgi:signal transduction histidine kinase